MSWSQEADERKGTAVEAEDEFQGPDTSSLAAFLLSLLSYTPVTRDYDTASSSSEESDEDSDGHERHPEGAAGGFGEGWVEDGTTVLGTTRMVKRDEPPVSPTPLRIPLRLPDMSDESALLTDPMRTIICAALPALAQGREWVLLYRSDSYAYAEPVRGRRLSLFLFGWQYCQARDVASDPVPQKHASRGAMSVGGGGQGGDSVRGLVIRAFVAIDKEEVPGGRVGEWDKGSHD